VHVCYSSLTFKDVAANRPTVRLVPFRRGYLLHGPPGDGKTSVIRATLSRPGICGPTLNFFADGIDDDSLEAMFNRAGCCAPSLIVLEDIDRAFPK